MGWGGRGGGVEWGWGATRPSVGFAGWASSTRARHAVLLLGYSGTVAQYPNYPNKIRVHLLPNIVLAFFRLGLKVLGLYAQCDFKPPRLCRDASTQGK